jgi:hypothetical protein
MRIASLFFVAVMCSSVEVDGCKKPSTSPEKVTPSNAQFEPHLQQEEPPTVSFEIKPAGRAGGPLDIHLYDCTYQAGGKTAKFRLQLKQRGPMTGEIPMASAEGKFIAVTGSDNSVLLEDLKKALEAKEIPEKYSRIAEVSFDAVVLVQRQSRDASGGYADKPQGDWMLVKLFLPKGGMMERYSST